MSLAATYLQLFSLLKMHTPRIKPISKDGVFLFVTFHVASDQ